jgi:ferredoxin
MRAGEEEIREALEEGVIIHHGQSLTRILGPDGKVCGAECLDVQTFQFEESSRLHVVTASGPAHIYQADTLIFAIGQSTEMHGFDGLELNFAGVVSVDPVTMATAIPGVFAGGELSRGPISIVEAIADGKRVAASIDAYLQGFIYRPRNPLQGIRPSEIQVRIPPGTEKRARQRAVRSPHAGPRSWEETKATFSGEAAVAEAGRCLNCAGHLCREVCPTHAPQFGAEPHSKMQKCDLCIDRWRQNRKPICVAACPTRAMDAGPLDELTAKYGDQREAEGFDWRSSTDPSIRFRPKKYRPTLQDGSGVCPKPMKKNKEESHGHDVT